MSRVPGRPTAAFMAVVLALAVSACGSSTKSKSTPAPPPASTPPAASTPSTTGPINTSGVVKPPPSTPVSSETFKTYLTQTYQAALTRTNHPAAAAKAPQLAACVIKLLELAELKTYADAKSRPALVKADQVACVRQLGLR